MHNTMNKLPIRDPSIKIVPSKELRKFIGTTIQISPSTPATVQEICTAFNTSKRNKASNKSRPNVDGKVNETDAEFTEKECSIIRQLVKEMNDPGSEPDTTAFMNADGGGKRQPATESTGTRLTVNDVKWLYGTLNQMRQTDSSVPYLHTLLSGCQLELPENPIQERNPELEARCQRLRKEQEDREYHRMTKNVDSVRKHMPEDTISYQMKQINRHLIAVAQFLFSVAAGFAFGFIGIELLIGQLDFGFRLLLGIIIALVIALAEIYFLAKKLNEEYELPPPPALVTKDAAAGVRKTLVANGTSKTGSHGNKEHHD